MADASGLPILLDGDTGYGSFDNVRRLVRKLERRGIAGVCIEDKQFPKTNSFIKGEAQPLADMDGFCGKIQAGKDSRTDEPFSIVARERRAGRNGAMGTRFVRLTIRRGTPDGLPRPTITPPVHAYYALVEALRELADEGGWQARHARYAALSEQVRAGLAARGIESVLPQDESSVVLRSFRLPKGVDYPLLHDALKARGFVIYAGQGGLSAELFRISTMGDIHASDIERLLAVFDGVIRGA